MDRKYPQTVKKASMKAKRIRGRKSVMAQDLVGKEKAYTPKKPFQDMNRSTDEKSRLDSSH